MAIGVKNQGRTGNCMFQFAFAYATSASLGTSFFVEDIRTIEWFKAHNRYRFWNNAVIFYVKWKYKASSLLKVLLGSNGTDTTVVRYLGLKVISIDPVQRASEISTLLTDQTFFMGYFQSFNFFRKSEEDIRRLFELKHRYRKLFLKSKKDHLRHKYIAVHVRRTDYIEWELEGLGEKNYTLPLQYYHDCFSKIGDIEEYKIIFLSDDIPFVKEHFGQMKNCTFESNTAVIDFQLLQHASILIMSNSSFAWWAAFLSEKEQRVFAPAHWIGFKVRKEFPAEIILPGWEIVTIGTEN
jgi:hypothetical protein